MRNTNDRILVDWKDSIRKLYGEEDLKLLENVVSEIKAKNIKKITKRLTNEDIFTIAYANSIKSEKPNLGNVPSIMSKYYPNINTIHFLPFFKWTSDDGFSVADYYKVDERNGEWDQLDAYKDKYTFMFDFVVNHSSKSNPWFKKFLKQEKGWENFYVTEDKNFDYSNIVRPRTSPLFHEYGDKQLKVWTTFSEDQVDLNYKSIHVLAEVVKLLGFYMEKGMQVVRLDAVGFIWKESGTTGMHHPNAHLIIKVIKSIAFELFGELKIISEVNVPHEENMSYLGENGNESDEVYNFALPPLMLYTILKGDATKFKEWMKFFENLGTEETMFNFLASHDGIGMRPVETILTEEEKNIVVEKAKKVNGKFNYKSLPDGSKTIYEINSTYVDMLFDNEGDETDYKKLLMTHSLILLLRGTPAIYINSLFAKRNYLSGVEETGQNRTINRELFDINTFDEKLSEKDLEFIDNLNKAMKIRKTNNDFDPYAPQTNIENLPKEIIGFTRSGNTRVFANVSNETISFNDIEINPYQIIVFKDGKLQSKIN